MKCINSFWAESILDKGPISFIFRLMQLLDRFVEGKNNLKVDKEFARILKSAEWNTDTAEKILDAYYENPSFIQRAIAGTAYQTELPDISIREMIHASATENHIANFNVANVLDARKRIEAKTRSESRGGEIEKQKKTVKGKKRTILDRKGRIIIKDGAIILVFDEENSGNQIDKLEPSNFKVTWRLKEGTCNEPVFGTDHVVVVARWKDGNGDSGVQFEAGGRASGLPWVFDENETLDMTKTIYGPKDPHGFLEMQLDFLEVDDPEKIIKFLEELVKGLTNVGNILNEPNTILAAHIANITVTLIKAITDDDGVDLGFIGHTYRTDADMNAANGKTDSKNLNKSQYFGYDWDYDFKYVLEKS